MSTSQKSTNLELFEAESIQDFPKKIITSILEYNKDLLIGDSTGLIGLYKFDNMKLVEYKHLQMKSKIDRMFIPEIDVLYFLSGGNIYLYLLPEFNDKTPRETDKESKDFKDIAQIVNDDKSELLIISKKKKIIFHYYEMELQRSFAKEYKDKEGKVISLSVDDIPEKIIWHGNSICYNTKAGKVFFITFKKNKDIAEISENKQDLPADNFIYIQSSWIILTGDCGLYFKLNGSPMSKNPINFEHGQTMLDLKVLNDMHIIALYKQNINIYENINGTCVQKIDIKLENIEGRQFFENGQKKIFLISANRKDEKAKDFSCNLTVMKEFSFEKQIKLSIKKDEIKQAFNLLNTKLDYNMEKFNFLETFYLDCAWNSMKKKTKEGYEEAEKYFSLSNFNPFELIYHFIKLLKIKPIHVGFEEIEKLKPEIIQCQIISSNEGLDNISKIALQMLISVLKIKKNHIIKINSISNKKNEIKTVLKNNIVSFESSQICAINLKNVEPKEIQVSEAIKMIDEALIKSMVLLRYDISLIEEIIEGEYYGINDFETFLSKIKSFTSSMTLSYIYKKSKKYNEVFKILEPYIHNINLIDENKQAVNLVKNILISFGKQKYYLEIFEQGLKLLIKNNHLAAFEVLLSHEIISIEEFMSKYLSNEQTDQNKKEIFLKLLCEDKKYAKYSNEKYQTLYIQILINVLFNKLKKDSIPGNKEQEKFPKEYNSFKEVLINYKCYNKSQILELIKNTWMYDVEILLLSKLEKNEEAIKKMIELIKANLKTFEDIREFCKINIINDNEIYKKYFQSLREKYDDKQWEQMKPNFKKEMLKLIYLYLNGQLIDEKDKKNKTKLEMLNMLNPKDILSLIPSDWKLNEALDENDNEKTIYSLMHFYLKEYYVIDTNYKRLENLAKMDLINKQKKLCDLREKSININSDTSCFLCGKKITNNTQFHIYPNGHIYHSTCSPDLYLEIKTGKNFKNFDY